MVFLFSFLLSLVTEPIALAAIEVCHKAFATIERDGRYVTVVRGSNSRGFMRTNRGYSELNDPLVRYKGKDSVTQAFSIDHLVKRKVLDIGTGDGQLVEDLRSMGVETEGLDIVLNTEQKTKKYFIEADIREIPIRNESYDTIISAYNIFHYEHSSEFYLEAIKEMHRILKPGGELIIIDANSGIKELYESEFFEVVSPAASGLKRYNNDILLRRK